MAQAGRQKHRDHTQKIVTHKVISLLLSSPKLFSEASEARTGPLEARNVICSIDLVGGSGAIRQAKAQRPYLRRFPCPMCAAGCLVL